MTRFQKTNHILISISYFRGILPYGQRKKLWEKHKTKNRKQKSSVSNSHSELVCGAQVCMKNSPMYHAGAIGFAVIGGVPKIGQLLNSAWNFNDTCRFRIIPNTHSMFSESSRKDTSNMSSQNVTNMSLASKSSSSQKENNDRIDMPPPPSPASSTCSDTGSISSKRQKRNQIFGSDSSSQDNKTREEEEWPLKDVVFVEDVRGVPTGRVVKVDGSYVAVKFPSIQKDKDKDAEDTVALLQDCRLLRKDDVQVIKSSSTCRAPDCHQKVPRRINIPDSLGQIITYAVDGQGIHAIVKNAKSKLSFVTFNLNTGRPEREYYFLSDHVTFMGVNNYNISLISAGDINESVLILRDGNKTIYPLAKDCAEALKDPSWLDLPPVSCINASSVALTGVGPNQKSQVAVIGLVLERQIMMPLVLKCDFEGVKQLIGQVENDFKNSSHVHILDAIINERCDGKCIFS